MPVIKSDELLTKISSGTPLLSACQKSATPLCTGYPAFLNYFYQSRIDEKKKGLRKLKQLFI